MAKPWRSQANLQTAKHPETRHKSTSKTILPDVSGTAKVCCLGLDDGSDVAHPVNRDVRKFEESFDRKDHRKRLELSKCSPMNYLRKALARGSSRRESYSG